MSPGFHLQKARITSPILSGLIWSCMWLAIASLALSGLLAAGFIEESGMLPWVFGAHGLSALAGGFVSARRSGRKGWSYGGICGAVYAALIILASFLAVDSEWSLRIVALLGLAALAGAFGGMIGVNTSRTAGR